MQLGQFVSAYEKSLIALNQEAADLKERISALEGKSDIRPGGRLASKLSEYRHRLASLKTKHRAAACWFGTVAEPVFSIIQKRLGQAYTGFFRRESDTQASLRFISAGQDGGGEIVLKMTLAALCTEPAMEAVKVMVQRSVTKPGSGRHDDCLPLDITIAEVLTPLSGA